MKDPMRDPKGDPFREEGSGAFGGFFDPFHLKACGDSKGSHSSVTDKAPGS